MNKKAILLYFLLSAIVQVIFAQTQKGYVRTLERPDVPSVALEGVSILMHGEHNIVLSAADGLFHLSMHGKRNGDSYTLQWVKKYGYELADQGVIGRRYAYSDSVPLIVVMVSTEQLYADKQRIENNAYLTAERNYSNQIDILKQQLADSTISEENYRNKINELQHNLEYYQALIGDLADHYARTDYALLDENERNVNLYIEQGELERADSLLQMMFDPIGVLERNNEALAEAYRRLAEGKYLMEQALKYRAEVLYQQAKDAENLYRLYTIAIARFEYNKAKQYIEIRAALDSANVEWQADAGLYCHNMADYNKAIDYYKNGLKHANDSSIWIALLYNNIGGIFSNYHRNYSTYSNSD